MKSIKQIKQQLKDFTLDPITRETLCQLLHYYSAEGIDPAVTHKPQSGYRQKARSVKRKKRNSP